MYRCQVCGEATPAGTPAVRLVVAKRTKSYPRRAKANREVPDPDRPNKKHRPDDPGGVGWEIAREVLACPGCVALSGTRTPAG